MTSKHIKISRRAERDYRGNWAEEYGDAIWWRNHPVHAISHVDLCKLAHHLIKNKHLVKKLYEVRRGGHIVAYEFNIHLAHRLTKLDVVFFDNYWHAFGFAQRIKAAASGS